MPEKQKIMKDYMQGKTLNELFIQDVITERYYQKEAVFAACDNLRQGRRKSLLVMASGTGKTKTAISLSDIFMRSGLVKNILFLTDNTVLVTQAKEEFKRYLPEILFGESMNEMETEKCNVIFSTYFDLFNITCKAQIDLIIIDEIHRSVLKDYHEFFEEFSSILVGFTSTPRLCIDQNIYDFFEVESGMPTYAYEYETAVYKDGVLVPYYNMSQTY